MTASLANWTGASPGFGTNTFDGGSFSDHGLPDDKEFRTDVVVMLRIGNCTLECFCNEGGRFFGNESQLL